MVELNIRKLLALKSLNELKDDELKSELDKYKKEDFIKFLCEIPKDNIAFLFEEETEEETEEELKEDREEVSI